MIMLRSELSEPLLPSDFLWENDSKMDAQQKAIRYVRCFQSLEIFGVDSYQNKKED